MEPFPSLADPATARARPIFLHGLWRSGSTYVWSCFRKSEATACFYEPLHEGLSRLTRTRIWRDAAAVGRALRHPSLDLPYFAEFEPLLGGRGVRGHDPSFARDRYRLDAGDSHPALERYIASLVAAAEAEGRTPVLGFNRTNFRMPWLNARFQPFNLYVERDPEAVWASYADHALRGNFAFLKNWMLTLERNVADPVFAPIAELAPLRRNLVERLRKPKRHYADVLRRTPPEAVYLVVYYLWLTSLIQAQAHADLVLDVSAAASDPALARRASQQVQARTGLEIDLGGCGSPPPRLRLSDDQRRWAEARAVELLPAAALAPLKLLAERSPAMLIRPEKAVLLTRLRHRSPAPAYVAPQRPPAYAPRPLRPALVLEG